MQKTVILITALVMMLTSSLVAQTFEERGPSKMPYNTKTQEFQYTATVAVDSVGRNAMMVRADRWIKAFYKNPTSVLKEKTDSTLLCKYQFNIFNESTGALHPQHHLPRQRIYL
jgi:hypothetical protein